MLQYSVKRKARAGVKCNVGVRSSWDSISSSTTNSSKGLWGAMPRERSTRRCVRVVSQGVRIDDESEKKIEGI